MPSTVASIFKLTTLQNVLMEEIQDLYSAKTRGAQALDKMAAAASDELLKKLFIKHLRKTENHVVCIEQAAKCLGISSEGKHSNGMMGIILDMEVMLRSQPSGVRDIQLVCTAQKMIHYNLVGYSSASVVAKLLKENEVARLLQLMLTEENAAKAELSSLGDHSLCVQFEPGSKPILDARKAI